MWAGTFLTKAEPRSLLSDPPARRLAKVSAPLPGEATEEDLADFLIWLTRPRPPPEVCGPGHSEMEKAAELMRWYDKHDIVSSKVCIRTPEGGVRGLFARESILPCEGIAVIPKHMIIQSPFKDLEEMVEKVKIARK